MHVSALSLTDFRSWSRLELALDPGPTALVGANGQGKTNVIEALGYAATLGSHRVSTDAPLVRAGAERAAVRVRVERAGRTTLVELELNPGRANRARVNRAPVPRAREVVGLLRTVLFAPEDLALVRGDPAERRRFLDELLVLRAPRYAGVRADYDRVLKQRNALLKTAFLARRQGGGDMRTLDVWDSHLARTGSQLLDGRLRLLDELAPHVAKAYADVAADVAAGVAADVAAGGLPGGSADATGAAEPSLAYRCSSGETWAATPGVDALAEMLLTQLAAVRAQERERGVSLVGPHRDELVLTLGDLPAKGYASHGESWSYALALRLAGFELLRGDAAHGDGEPVLVLDDVFAELDEGRRGRLAARVGQAEQVLVTAAVPDDVPAQLQGARYEVRAGAMTRVA